jgi:uncharacterized OsmC-like protein
LTIREDGGRVTDDLDTLVVDEPSVRGGDSRGPTPLGYFVAGAASCLAMQYAGLIKDHSIPVTGLKVLARAHHDRDPPQRRHGDHHLPPFVTRRGGPRVRGGGRSG